LTLSNYLTDNKSKIDYSSPFNIGEIPNAKTKTINKIKGNKCTCK
jgi:hypothetical protein